MANWTKKEPNGPTSRKKWNLEGIIFLVIVCCEIGTE